MNWRRLIVPLFAVGLIAHGQIPSPVDAPKPLSPEQSAAAFRVPEGFRMEVAASEPLIASPSGVCWDEQGRMFVSELHGYNLEGQLDIDELNKTGKLDTEVRRVQADDRFKEAARPGTYGVVKLLHDRDGDGRMDKVDVWATNLPPAYGLVAARGGVIVACAPDIVFLADRDEDGIAEIRERLFSGFRTGALERGINSPQWGLDGWIYCARGWGSDAVEGPKLAKPVKLPDSDFRFRPDGSAIEPVTGRTHTFGFAMTESQERFVMTTAMPGIFVAPLPWRYLARNAHVAFSSLTVETGDRRVYPLAPPHPWRAKRAEDPGFSKYYRDRYGAAESDASGWFTSACGPMIYHDSVLPGLHGHYFACEPAGNLIHRAIIERDGSILHLRRGPEEEKSEFAASRDPWSHPISLAHGPDGAIWVVDYYREIIEDYSAIPRYLQQQYGLYAGHDRGRIYRLTHRDARPMKHRNMAALDSAELVGECDSPILWRRQTAQRLLIERGDKSTSALLRQLLASRKTQPSGVIVALRSLEALGALGPEDARHALEHSNEAVRVHALQLAEQWLNDDTGLIETALRGSDTARTRIQLALSLGESRDPRALAILARLARDHLDIRWMDAAILSSLHGRGIEMLAELVRQPGAALPLLPQLAQMIAAGRDEMELGRTLALLKSVGPDIQVAVLDGVVKGRKNASRRPLTQATAREMLAFLAASPSSGVRSAARAVEETFLPGVDNPLTTASLPPIEKVSPAEFRKFRQALSQPRNPQRGGEIFRQACALCHRVDGEGHDVGPDLMGQAGMPEESLLQDIIAPNSRIRPGFETTLIDLEKGVEATAAIGLLKDDGATSLTLAAPGGLQQVFLRKDILGVRRVAQSMMPSFAEGLTPAEVADVLAWLRSRLNAKAIGPAEP